ncbi:MAG TPA: TPM domain-containing protein, partial [Parasegetibacter sp.]
MKKFTGLIILFLFSTWILQAQEIPKPQNPPKLVNDFANILTHDQQLTLESKLVAYNDSTSNEVAIVTIKTTGDYEISDYALKILREWGVGDKKNNNGLVILAAIDDGKIWISTGYGLEGALPDITVKNIIENEILPSFRQGNYYRGFSNAVDAVIKAAAGEYKAKPKAKKGKGGEALAVIVVIAVLLLLMSGGAG